MSGKVRKLIIDINNFNRRNTISKFDSLTNLKNYSREFNNKQKILLEALGVDRNYKIFTSKYKKGDNVRLVNDIKKSQTKLGYVMGKYINDTNTDNDIIEKFYKKYKETPENKFLLVNFNDINGKNYTRVVNEKFLSRLAGFIEEGKGTVSGEEYMNGSDVDADYSNVSWDESDFTFFTKDKPKISQAGSYFNYLNGTKLDLSVLQIYNKEQYNKQIEKGIENCVINSLINLYIPLDKIKKIKQVVENYDKMGYDKAIINDAFITRNLKKIAVIIEKDIKLKKFYRNEKNILIEKNMATYKCGFNNSGCIQICLYKEHYMPNIELEYNAFVVKNYEKIKDIDNFQTITRKRGNKYTSETTSQTKATTTDIIRMLDRTGYYYKDEVLTKHINYKEDNTHYLESSGEQTPILNETAKAAITTPKKQKTIFFADSETYKKYNKLVPFLVGVVGMENDNVVITKNTTDFLDYIVSLTGIKDDIVVYFHNAKFDYSVMFSGYMKGAPTIKNGQFYEGVIYRKGRKIIIKDSMKHIAMALSKFKSTYKLKVGKKDIYMPYSAYTQYTIKNKSLPYNLLLESDKDLPEIEKLNTDEKKAVIEPYCYLTKAGIKRFRHMDYMRDYLEYDCLTLKHGFLKHRDNIFKLCDKLKIERLDIFDILTTSSLSYKLYQAVGTYEGVYELSGNKRRFVQKSIIGGRVSTKRNKKHLSKEVMDYDACSLYPSAIYRLAKEYGGIPVGEAKNITNFDEIKNNTYYVVEIEVLNIDDNQQISFFNYHKEGKRTYDGNYQNFRDNVKDGKIIVDRITLEDYCEFQGMKYKFIQGLYWDKFSPVMSNLTHDLYNIRKEYKAMKDDNGNITEEGDLLQGTTKLILNSIYGKTLLKPSTQAIKVKLNKKYLYEKEIVDGKKVNKKDENGKYINVLDEETKEPIYSDEANKYLIKNYNTINYMVKEYLTTTFYCNYNDFNDRNACHIGGMILSMSKRIMNEVMNTANENDIEILYQDTDSMHIHKKDIKKLEDLFYKKYGRSLRGGNLGEFHNDLEGYFQGNIFDCVSDLCIILGKKAYLDVLKIDFESSKNKYIIEKNNLDIEKLKNERQYHIRLKGVGSFAFKQNYKDIIKAYKDLYEGKELEFDLTKGSVKFEITNMNQVLQKNNFIRKVKFL